VVGDRAFATDVATIVLVSVAICVFSQRLALMTVLVPIVLVARLGVWLALPAAERDTSRAGELAFFAVCTLLGAFNDWSSVTRHRIYDYTVPTDLPGLSHIPIWMLLYWGMILRFMITLGHYRRIGLSSGADELHFGRWRVRGGGAKIALQLGLVLATRQAIYRTYDHPIWSWAPFALGLAVALFVLRPPRRRLTLLAGVLVAGPLVEALYIQVGGLHVYRLGWLFGVPLWIALWWVLAVLIWQDLGGRLLVAIDGIGRRARGAA